MPIDIGALRRGSTLIYCFIMFDCNQKCQLPSITTRLSPSRTRLSYFERNPLSCGYYNKESFFCLIFAKSTSQKYRKSKDYEKLSHHKE